MSTKPKRIRSPAYPAVSFKVALKKAEEFYRIEGRNEAFLSVALKHLGYSPTSGTGLKLVAALSSFGLVDTSGSGKNRKLKLSENALRILLDKRENSTERENTIQSLALKPKIYQKLWNLWHTELPSVASIRHHLIFEEKFNEKFVGPFIKDYKETIEFTNLAGFFDNEENELSSEESGNTPKEEANDHYAEQPEEKTSQISDSRIVPGDNVEIAKYPVAKNCTIRIIADGIVNRKEIEALVAQLNLNLQLGVFDEELIDE